MANPSSGNLYTQATDLTGFPPQGTGTWTVSNDFAGTLTVVTLSTPSANHGNYSYTPSAAEQAAADAAGVAQNITGNLTFVIDQGSGCTCTVTTPFCVIVEPSVDPCDGRSFPSQTFTDTCELDATIVSTGHAGWTDTNFQYTLCPGQTWVPFGGVAPVVNITTGQITWNPPVSATINHTFQVCVNSAGPAGCDVLPFDVTVTLNPPTHQDSTSVDVNCDFSIDTAVGVAGITNPMYSVCPGSSLPPSVSFSSGGVVSSTGIPESLYGTTQTFEACVVGDEGCEAQYTVSLTFVEPCSGLSISFPT